MTDEQPTPEAMEAIANFWIGAQPRELSIALAALLDAFAAKRVAERVEQMGREFAAARELWVRTSNAQDANIAEAERRGAERMRDVDVLAAYNRLWNERAKDNTDQFTSGLLAGMTEFLNAIRALPLDPPKENPDG